MQLCGLHLHTLSTIMTFGLKHSSEVFDPTSFSKKEDCSAACVAPPEVPRSFATTSTPCQYLPASVEDGYEAYAGVAHVRIAHARY